jgi:uncharacterized protein (TIGR02246 family)
MRGATVNQIPKEASAVAIPNDGLRKAIVAANRDFMDTFARGDAEGMGRLYTTGGQLLPVNSEFVTGREAVQAFCKTVMDMGIKTAQLETVELEAYDDTAVEVGRYILAGDGGQVLDKGKYVVIWKQEKGQWKLHRDIWTASMPAF